MISHKATRGQVSSVPLRTPGCHRLPLGSRHAHLRGWTGQGPAEKGGSYPICPFPLGGETFSYPPSGCPS